MATPAVRDGRSTEELLVAAGTVAGSIAGLGGFVYLVGGLVMWLRFRTADLPADQGVALMSKEQLFVVGLRLMILPLLVTGTLAVVLADRATSTRTGRPLGWVTLALAGFVVALLIVWSFAVAGWPTGLALLLEGLVLTGGGCVLVIVRGRRRDPDARVPRWPAVAAVAAAALVLVLCLAVPGLRVSDEVTERLAVAAVALLAMFTPALALAPSSLRRPPRWLWLVILAAAVVLAVVAAAGFWAKLAVVLGAVVVTAAAATAYARWTRAWASSRKQQSGREQQPGRWRRWVLALVAVLAIGLIVPWSFASATWPIGLGLLLGVALWRRRRFQAAMDARAATDALAATDAAAAPPAAAAVTDADVARERRRMAHYIAAAAVLAAAVVSIGRQLDEPVQLLHATVTFKERGVAKVEGTYLNATGDTVFVGDLEEQTIIAIPRGDVRDVAVGPPEERAPSASLVSRIIPGVRRFSARPLEVWCDGERYRWTEADTLCRAHPQLLWKTRNHHRDFDRLGAPVRVRCPREASGVCRGWVLLRSRSLYLHGPVGVPRPVVPEPVRFAVGAGKPTEVCLTLTPGQFGLLRGRAGEKPVAFDAVVARDREGETVSERGYYGLYVGPGRVEHRPLGASDCEPRLTLAVVRQGNAVRVTVAARPRGRGVTPRRVEGAVRLRATRRDGTVRRLGTTRLGGGKARVATTLPRGTWEIAARYTSVIKVRYAEVLAKKTVTITRRERPAPAPTGRSGGTAAPG